MNDANHAAPWRTLAAAAPALIAADLRSGIALGLLALALSAGLAALARASAGLAPPLRQTLLLIAAATLAAAGDLCLQAFAWETLDAVRPWLPLLAVGAVLLAAPPAATAGWDGAGEFRLWGMALLSPLLVGALRELDGLLFFRLPGAPLIALALLIAAANRWRRPGAGQDASRRARRVRVTGPVG